MTYRNTKSGAVIESESRITGEFWEEIPGTPDPVAAETKEPEPKDKKRRKKE